MSILYMGWDPVPTDEEIEASMNDHEEAFGREELEAISDAANNGFYLNPLDLPDFNPAPTFMADSQGQFMFTPGSVVTIFGEPGVRKSFLLQTAVGEHFGIMMQMESSPRGLIKRLRSMGFPRNSSLRYTFPQSGSDVTDMVEAWKDTPPTIIGIDSMAHLASFFNTDTNSDSDMQKVFKKVIHPLRDAGHCVVFLDHVPKSSKNQGYATGSQNKKAQSDIALRIDRVQKSGEYRLYVTKDRDNLYGDRGLDSSGFYGLLELTENPTRVQIKRIAGTYDLSEYEHLGAGQISSANRKEKIIEYLRAHGCVGKEELRRHVGGNASRFGQLIDELCQAGLIAITSGLDYMGKRCRALVSLA